MKYVIVHDRGFEIEPGDIVTVGDSEELGIVSIDTEKNFAYVSDLEYFHVIDRCKYNPKTNKIESRDWWHLVKKGKDLVISEVVK